jgi:hypothetical protein
VHRGGRSAAPLKARGGCVAAVLLQQRVNRLELRVPRRLRTRMRDAGAQRQPDAA